MANVGDPAKQNAANDSHVASGVSMIQDGRLFRPSRCDVNVEYVVFVQSKRQDYSMSENSVCSFYGESRWNECDSCDQCPSALFFKVEKEDQSLLFSPLYISNLFSIIIIVALLIIVLFSR